jgi:hypothetical protein
MQALVKKSSQNPTVSDDPERAREFSFVYWVEFGKTLSDESEQ